MGHHGTVWIARAKDVYGIRAVVSDCDRMCDDRIACRFTSHTFNSLIGRDAANVGCSLDVFSSRRIQPSQSDVENKRR